ncbi:protein transport protein Sec24A-like [Paramacrobiotus metropolitanus]|uniref:protein transport protein Sec24A-like n=1 Tax=Paramacrobiotus metropolitanus TaxID=2943436 RepID=UPI002445F0F9|nr:protein transport protein Sec24A-like [Paramacrobiotus metropolitanus]
MHPAQPPSNAPVGLPQPPSFPKNPLASATAPSFNSQFQPAMQNLGNQLGNMSMRPDSAPQMPLVQQAPRGPSGLPSPSSLPQFAAAPLSKPAPALSNVPLPQQSRAPQFAPVQTNGNGTIRPSSSMPAFPNAAAPQSLPSTPNPGGLPVKFPQPPRFANGPSVLPSPTLPQPAPTGPKLPQQFSQPDLTAQSWAPPGIVNGHTDHSAPSAPGPHAAPSFAPPHAAPNAPAPGPLMRYQYGGVAQPQATQTAPQSVPNYAPQAPNQQGLQSPFSALQQPAAGGYQPAGYGGATDGYAAPGAMGQQNQFQGAPPGMFPQTGQAGGQQYGAPATSPLNTFGGAPMMNGPPQFMGPGAAAPATSPMGEGLNPEGGRLVNLMHSRNILPPDGPEIPRQPMRNRDYAPPENCSPEIFRCTLNAIPKSPALLSKSRLPLGILIHPFKDLSTLQVLTCTTIVRCRACRSYINPFVMFVDQQRWKCNLCDRTNDLPHEFFHDPVTHTVGDASRRPELRTATIEFIAPQEYSLRPPQPAIYVFLLDISFNAIESRYLESFCERLSTCLERLPGDARTQIAFIAFDSAIHFFQLESDWRMLTVADIEDVFLPTTDGILIRLHENISAIRELLNRLPGMFRTQRDTHSCTGAAIQAGYKLLTPTGGRITVMQTGLPTIGPGALKAREDPNMRAAKDIKNLTPATDFYKTLALECSEHQVTVDLFLLAGQYSDLASLGGISRYSAGCVHYYPGYNAVTNPAQLERFEVELTRYLQRKIGFEAVMRVRCTNGLSMHTFHGNFFVRSTDLLSLPNINPDAGFAVQIKLDETLNHTNSVCFQAALLYTSSKGERRIRVHTLHCPVTDSIGDVFACADQEAIACFIGKIAAERALSHPMAEVRDGVVYACEDALSSFTQVARNQGNQLLSPYSLRLVPLFTQALLKNFGLRIGVSTTLDLRTYFLLHIKAAPLFEEMILIYPHLYPVHDILHATEFLNADEGIPKLPRLQLSYEQIDLRGVYLLEAALHMILYVGKGVSSEFCRDVFDCLTYEQIIDRNTVLPELDNETSRRVRSFVLSRYAARPLHPVLEVIKEDSKDRLIFLQYLHDDRLESTSAYYEFLTQLSQKIKAS